MSPFALEEPASLAEALALLDPDDPAVRAIAGGTALMLMMKSGLYRPQRLVSLRRLGPALTGIQTAADGGLEIGAMVRLAEIARAAAIRMAAPAIAATPAGRSAPRPRPRGVCRKPRRRLPAVLSVTRRCARRAAPRPPRR